MNVVIALGNWNDPGTKFDSDTPIGGRIVRGRLLLAWSKPIDPDIEFSLTLSVGLGEGRKLEQSLTIRRA